MKIIKTARYLQKTSQFDDFGDYGAYDEGSDLDNWENEQVFRDHEGMEDDYEDTDEYLSIEPVEFDGATEYEVIEHGVYPESSVLAGQPSRRVIDSARTIEELQQKYPQATTSDVSTHMPSEFGPAVSDVPPDGFDEADIGERW